MELVYLGSHLSIETSLKNTEELNRVTNLKSIVMLHLRVLTIIPSSFKSFKKKKILNGKIEWIINIILKRLKLGEYVEK